MSQPLLDAAIGLWLAKIHQGDEKVSATFATTDAIAVVVTIEKGDMILSYEGTLLTQVTVTPKKIDFIDKAFETLPVEKRPRQFFWSAKPPTKSELSSERQPGIHSRRIWLVHPVD